MSQDLLAAFDLNYQAGHSEDQNGHRTQERSQTFPDLGNQDSLLIDIPEAHTEGTQSATNANRYGSNIEPVGINSAHTLSDTVPTQNDAEEWGEFETEGNAIVNTTPHTLSDGTHRGLEALQRSNSYHQPDSLATSEPDLPHVVATTQYGTSARPDASSYSSGALRQEYRYTNSAPKPFPAAVNQMPQIRGAASSTQSLCRPLSDPNILFDADDYTENGEDFGEFEGQTVAPEVSVRRLLPHQDVSQASQSFKIGHPGGLQSNQQALYNQANRHTAMSGATGQHQSHLHARKRQDTSYNSKAKPVSKLSDVVEGVWDDFLDFPAVAEPRQASQALTAGAHNLEWQPSVKEKTSLAAASLTGATPPPTNVPPPGVLLSLFPGLFKEAHKRLYEATSSPSEVRRNAPSEAAAEECLKSYLNLATVAARIIAGRKLRWKRDKFLAQGTKIGPASIGRPSGMKLTGIDKAENIKEEREVADVVVAWRQHAGRLRSMVATANTAGATALGPVPDIQENLPVKIAKADEGALTAPQQCFLCGLKRDERITKVDAHVEDSFSEWWIDHWGHLNCRNFWIEYKDSLHQR